MKRFYSYAILLVLFNDHLTFAQKSVQLSSPNGSISYSFKLEKQKPVYSILFHGKPLIQYSPISLQFETGSFGSQVMIHKPEFREGSEDYQLTTGKAKKIHSHYKEVLIPLEQSNALFSKVNIRVRAFDDGVAFRYEFPVQKDISSLILNEENTECILAGNPLVKSLFLPSYTTSHEGLYTTMPWNQVKEDTLMDMPALFEFPGNIYMAITEAALLDYAGMYLSKHNGRILSKLSPLPDQGTVKVKAALPHESPWRVLMISDRIGALIESNIITDLNEPCKIKDLAG